MIYGRDEFPKSVKLAAWQRCGGYCEHPACRRKIMGGAIYDHLVPTSLGGPSTLSNCRVTCKRCDRLKTYQHDIPAIAKCKRIENRRAGLRPAKQKIASRPFNSSRNIGA